MKVMKPRQPHKQKPQIVKRQANERLAQALRDNLHRRKAQARARASALAIDAGDTILPDKENSAE